MHEQLQEYLNMGGAESPLFLCPESGVVSEASHRLVKASKSPTTEFFPGWRPKELVKWEPERIKTPVDAVGCKTVIEFREWQDAWRVRTEAECISGNKPPEQTERHSDMLTARGASKIAESCEYMHLQKGGFKTFVTGTFKPEVREQIESGKTSIQKEVTRTLDALQKMYQRGWTKSDGERVEGHAEGLPYLWVVEVPVNEDGERNPHIHMLLGWRVEYRHFEEWAARIESIWGNGYFHLEKIKDSACAGAYMAKAAGYLTKAAEQNDQGFVEGNRYGISKTARAPAWVVVEYAQLQAMGQLIYDVYDHLTVKYGEQYRERKNLNQKLSETPKSDKVNRKSIGERLAKVRKTINAIPIRCNKYQIVVKGKEAADYLFHWLVTPQNYAITPEWLPEKPIGWHWEKGAKPKAENSQFFHGIYKKFEQNRFWRRLVMPSWMEEVNESHNFWQAVKHEHDLMSGAELVPAYMEYA